MKKAVVLSLLLSVVASPLAFARTIEGPDAARHAHRAQQIEQRRASGAGDAENTRPAPAAQGQSKWNKFWENEGERSGLGGSGSRVGNFFRNLNPAPFLKKQEEAYEARKTAAK